MSDKPLHERIAELIAAFDDEALIQLDYAFALLREAAAELSRMRTALEDAEKDASRYQHIRFEYAKDDPRFRVFRYWLEPHSQTGEPTLWQQRAVGTYLDTLIDADMAARDKNKQAEPIMECERTFYIQQAEASHPAPPFVDDYKHPGCKVLGTVMAASYSLACEYFYGDAAIAERALTAGSGTE